MWCFIPTLAQYVAVSPLWVLNASSSKLASHGMLAFFWWQLSRCICVVSMSTVSCSRFVRGSWSQLAEQSTSHRLRNCFTWAPVESQFLSFRGFGKELNGTFGEQFRALLLSFATRWQF